jgi:hypothetical protein
MCEYQPSESRCLFTVAQNQACVHLSVMHFRSAANQEIFNCSCGNIQCLQPTERKKHRTLYQCLERRLDANKFDVSLLISVPVFNTSRGSIADSAVSGAPFGDLVALVSFPFAFWNPGTRIIACRTTNQKTKI